MNTVIMAIGLVIAAGIIGWYLSRPGTVIASNISEGIWKDNAYTAIAGENITDRYLFGTIDANNEVKIATGAAAPMAIITDQADDGDPVVCALLGPGLPGTMKVVAGSNISQGAEVYCDAAGKARDLPAAPGTYYKCGRAIRAAVSGQLVEIVAIYPVAVEVDE